ncbi:hypothetical protein [Methanocella arvoryzae]|uniref:hypothetical protein n=1 Tax=Methanocella arvoryzae TaxID=1175445 RepID=UPI00032578D7|nr:hypothetical protein [Methanocella arvoryzae]
MEFKHTIQYLGGNIECHPAYKFVSSKTGENVETSKCIKITGLGKFPVKMPASLIVKLMNAYKGDEKFQKFVDELAVEEAV